MKTFNDILEILKPAFDKGIVFEIKSINNNYVIDLQTKAKSGCSLYIENDKIMSKLRYGEINQVFDFDDILSEVFSCVYGRSYLSSEWLQLLLENGFSDPRGDL